MNRRDENSDVAFCPAPAPLALRESASARVSYAALAIASALAFGALASLVWWLGRRRRGRVTKRDASTEAQPSSYDERGGGIPAWVDYHETFRANASGAMLARGEEPANAKRARVSAPARLRRISGLLRGKSDREPSPPSPPPPASEWTQHPIHMTAPSYARCAVVSGRLVYNAEVPFEFETPLFKGKCLCRFRDCDPPPDASERVKQKVQEYFKGKKRTFQFVVQGRFKVPLRVDDCFTGHEFHKPLVGIPARFLIKSMLKVIRTVNASLKVKLFARRPQVWSSLCASAQTMSIDASGDEPDIASFELPENTSRLGGPFAQRAVTSKARRRMLSNPKAASKHALTPEFVYTFDFYQHFFRPDAYAVDVAAFLGRTLRLDVAAHVDGQPAQIMAKSKSHGEYIFCFALWHAALRGPRPPDHSP